MTDPARNFAIVAVAAVAFLLLVVVLTGCVPVHTPGFASIPTPIN
jgi:hypothetical protein